ncbi:MAG: CAP domain-containing protein [Ruminiclostridium sp.]|nr:CAP domain-containing protein [Ruminiclostridium sp.]
MKKTVKRLTSVLAAAIMATAALSASSSAVSLCFGGRCFNIGLPSGSGCSALIQQLLTGNSDVPASSSGCANGQNCTGSDCGTAAGCTGADCDGITTGCTGEDCGAVSVSGSADVNEVFDLVNSERAKKGLSALTFSDELSNAAQVRAEEIVRSFSHTRPNGTNCFTVLKESGITYRSAGENLAYGQKTAAAVMNGWMNSSGHRANILGKSFGKIGIACYVRGGVKYWVQLFTD